MFFRKVLNKFVSVSKKKIFFKCSNLVFCSFLRIEIMTTHVKNIYIYMFEIVSLPFSSKPQQPKKISASKTT